LVESNHQVVGCDLSLFPEAICGDLALPNLQLIKDFRDLKASELDGIDAVAHLAGISNDPMGDLNPGLTLEVNGNATVRFARLARESGVGIFAFASSCSIYGSNGSNARSESDVTNPLSEYAHSKLVAESGLQKLCSNNFRTYLLRNATAYGASNVFRTDLVINDLSSNMAAKGSAEIRSDGTPWRPFINCADMARAFQTFIESNPIELSGKPVNIGFNDENFQIREIGKLVSEVWPEGKLTYSAGPAKDPRDYKVDFSLFQRFFPDFEPILPMSKGIDDLKMHLLKIGYNEKDYQNKKFVRLEEIRKRILDLRF
jgi:nucleoside-diphosphate-sugar epimerase